jgi:hypothetical protein
MRPIATKNGEPLKRRRRARSRRRAAGRERQAPLEGPAPPLAWPVVHSAGQPLNAFRAPLPAPPWIVEETDACFIVRDANGQVLACVYFEEELGRRAGGQAADPGRGPAHRSEYRQAAGPAQAGTGIAIPR